MGISGENVLKVPDTQEALNHPAEYFYPLGHMATPIPSSTIGKLSLASLAICQLVVSSIFNTVVSFPQYIPELALPNLRFLNLTLSRHSINICEK